MPPCCEASTIRSDRTHTYIDRSPRPRRERKLVWPDGIAGPCAPKLFALAARWKVGGSGALADAQAGRAGARVGGDLGVAGDDRLAGDERADRCGALAGALGEVGRQRAGPREVAEAVLDQAILERVEADDRAAAAGRKQVGEAGEEALQLVELP